MFFLNSLTFLLVIREIQINTTMKCHLKLVRMAIMKKSINTKCWRGCEEKVSLLHCYGNVDWCNRYGEEYGSSLNRTKNDPAIPLLGLDPEKTMTPKDTSISMFIAGLLTIARTWKQPKCSLTEEWIKMMWHIYIYSGILSSHKKE